MSRPMFICDEVDELTERQLNEKIAEMVKVSRLYEIDFIHDLNAAWNLRFLCWGATVPEEVRERHSMFRDFLGYAEEYNAREKAALLCRQFYYAKTGRDVALKPEW